MIEDWNDGFERVLRPLPNGKVKTMLATVLALPFRIVAVFIVAVIGLFIVGVLFNLVAQLLSGGIPAVVKWWATLFDGVFR